MKFAVLSAVVPPSASGVAIMLYHLLREYRGDEYCLISDHDYSPQPSVQSYTKRLPGTYYSLPEDTVISLGSKFYLPQRLGYVYISVGILSRARKIAAILRREKSEALVACSGGWDCLNMPAGYLAARMLRIPYYAYIFDYYAKQWEGANHWGNGAYSRVGRKLESMCLNGAAGVIVPNEFLATALKDQYQLEPLIIHNPCDLSRYDLTFHQSDSDDGERRVVYTGDIYDAHFDAVANLMDAIKLTGRTDLKLHAYTIRPLSYLKANGVEGPIVLHPHIANEAMPEVQRQADVLFLPLAFKSPYPEGNKTAAPGKIGEYLASGRPVLVHAPADSFTAWYFRTHDCGLVIDEDDPAALANGLELLLTDESLQRRLVTNALARARIDFDVNAMRDRFQRLLKSKDDTEQRTMTASEQASASGSN